MWYAMIGTLTSGFWLTSYLLSISCTVMTPVLSESIESKAIFTSLLLLEFKSPIIPYIHTHMVSSYLRIIILKLLPYFEVRP